MAAFFELSPDAMVCQTLYFLADEPHATLSIARSFGTLAQGGDFESVYAMIRLFGRDDLAGVELFELDDLDAAGANRHDAGASLKPDARQRPSSDTARADGRRSR